LFLQNGGAPSRVGRAACARPHVRSGLPGLPLKRETRGLRAREDLFAHQRPLVFPSACTGAHVHVPQRPECPRATSCLEWIRQVQAHSGPSCLPL
jgi:hypothetical protein